MKNIPAKQTSSSTAAFAVPLSTFENETEGGARATGGGTEVSRHMLLIRLSEASARIRDEAQLIRSVGFTDPSARLLRILAETAEEQHLALARQEK